MQTLILVTLALAAVALAWSYRRPPQAVPVAALPAPDAPREARPPRVANPCRANRPDVKVWVLNASPACELTREFLHGRRFSTEEAVALPAVGCNLTDCRCRYEPVSDTRRRERRHDADRRHAIRFQDRNDRRFERDRRQNDIWQRGKLQ